MLISAGSLLCVAVIWPAWEKCPAFTAGTLIASTTLLFMGVVVHRYRNLRTLGTSTYLSGLLWPAQWVTTWNVSVLPFMGVQANTWFYTVGGIGLMLTSSDGHIDRLRVLGGELVLEQREIGSSLCAYMPVK